MSRLGSRRLGLATAGMLVAAAGLGFLGLGLAGRGHEHARPAPIRVTGSLPSWLAPGARLDVAGWAAPAERLSLIVGGRTVAVTRSGPRGRFVLRAKAPPPGRYRVVVAGAPAPRRAGGLLVRALRLAAVGDVTPGEGVSETIADTGIGYPWSSVAPVLRSADIATANLEGVISIRGTPAPYRQYHFRGNRGLIEGAARSAGIDVVTVANNHSLDYGADALLDTLRAARAAGIRTVGGGADIDAARRPAIIRAGGLRVAMLGYSDVRPYGSDAGPSSPGTARADPTAIAADVRRAGRQADLVVVWFHWGVELQTEPDLRQRELAAAALGAGADVVLGAHPHVLQPIERHGRKLVAWSLGNFVFPSGAPATRHTGILVVDLNARGVGGVRLEPVTIHGFRPELETAAAS